MILSQCNDIIDRPEWKEKIVTPVKKHNDNFKFFCACNVANRMKIDVSAELFDAVKAQPLENYSHIQQLLKRSDMASEVINLYETILPLDDMADGMGNYLFSNKLNQEHHCLEFILQELGVCPCQGTKLIKTGLNSKVIRGRNMACRALSGWVKVLGKPLAAISPELYTEVARIYEIEVNKETKETLKKLLDGGAVYR